MVRQEWMDVGDVTLLREEVTILVYWTDGRGRYSGRLPKHKMAQKFDKF